MAFPEAFLDELTARNPIEDVVGQTVNLKRSGSNLFGLCPFHGEKTASFSVNPDKGIYYCFGCHKGGGVVNFQMEIEGLSYPDAVRSLAKRCGMEVPEDEQYQSRYKQQERLWALHKEAARFFHSQLYGPAGQEALHYALGRGMNKYILTTFGVFATLSVATLYIRCDSGVLAVVERTVCSCRRIALHIEERDCEHLVLLTADSLGLLIYIEYEW